MKGSQPLTVSSHLTMVPLLCAVRNNRIALSTMEVEFMAFLATAQEAVWLKRFLYHLDVVKHISQLMVVYSDNEAAIAYTKDPKYHGKTKYIDRRFNYFKDLTEQKELNKVYISMHEMLADSFTNLFLELFLENTWNL